MADKSYEMIDKLVDYASGQKNVALLTYIKNKADLALKKHTALVRYAGELSDAVKTQLTEAVKIKFSDAQEVEFEQDSSLIGGIQVVFQDYRYEGSVRGRFERIRARVN